MIILKIFPLWIMKWVSTHFTIFIEAANYGVQRVARNVEIYAKFTKDFNLNTAVFSKSYDVLFELGWQDSLYSLFVEIVLREYIKYVVPISDLRFLLKFFLDHSDSCFIALEFFE